jgi:MFS family permease
MSQPCPLPVNPPQATARTGLTAEERRVIAASSVGTVFEWYDFYLYGSLATIISRQFFSAVDETTAFVFALLAFAAGFAVRPFGAILFGRLGDMLGRKHTFLLTILIMGFSTAVVGLLPSYASIGIAAPVLLVAMRMLQGLALGGEYGGAVTFVAEHAPPGKRGAFTSWIQATATLGLLLSLLVILGCRLALGPAFDAWGWRIPFLLSFALLAVSVYIRLRVSESPVFRLMKARGQSSTAPVTESFARWGNLKLVLLVLFGGVAGQAVVWYTGQFYALFFLLQTLKLEPQAANLLVAASLILGTPFFLLFGALSDRIGRRNIIVFGCVLAALTYFPIFEALTEHANPAIARAQATSPITVLSSPGECSFQFDPIGEARFTSSCDVAKSWLAKKGLPYRNGGATPGALAAVTIGGATVPSFDGRGLAEEELRARSAELDRALSAAVREAGYPAKADMSAVNYPMVIALLTLLVVYVAMVYGPMAAWLAELFPARIRYTSLSLPYHLGNGWFGGFLPTVAFAMVAATGDIYFGLWYPVGVAVMTAVIGTLFLPETRDRDLSSRAGA